jgi:hypothetical protein
MEIIVVYSEDQLQFTGQVSCYLALREGEYMKPMAHPRKKGRCIEISELNFIVLFFLSSILIEINYIKLY